MSRDWEIPPRSQELWRALSGLRPEPLPDAAADAMRRALDPALTFNSYRRHRMRKTMIGMAASLVLALVIGGAAGFRLAAADGPTAATADVPAGERYLLLVHETEATERAVREQGLQAVVAEYAAWAGELASSGRLIDAEKLTDVPEWVGRDPSAGSAISGFFLIRADSRQEAMRIARESPHARYGGVVEVRAVDDTAG